MVELSASILSIEEENSNKIFYNLEAAKIDYFHIDVMDGNFVKNETLTKMENYTNALNQITNLPLDVHLMVEDVEKYVEEYSLFNPSIITFQLEALKEKKDVERVIEKIKERNIKVGIAIKPNTKIEELYPYINKINLALIMTVEPGYGGQTLLPETISKIKELKKYIDKQNLETYIEADGGINLKNCEELKQAGVEIIVVGSALVKSENYESFVKEIKK